MRRAPAPRAPPARPFVAADMRSLCRRRETAKQSGDSPVAKLMEMGFSESDSKAVLEECGGDVDAALNKLLGTG